MPFAIYSKSRAFCVASSSLNFGAAVAAEEVEVAGARRDLDGPAAARGRLFLEGGRVRLRDFHDKFAQVRVVENCDRETCGPFLVGYVVCK